MPTLELHFPVLGETLPTDHAYPLYAALSRVVPALHNGQLTGLAIGPIGGTYIGGGKLALTAPRSRLRLRLPDDRISLALPLAGKALEIDGHRVRLGVPFVRALEPATALFAGMVTIKHHTEPASFMATVRRDLDALNVAGEPGIPLVETGPRAGQPFRRVVRIHGRRMVGFSLRITGLTAAESLTLLELGLGGRRRLGCGFFVPMRERAT